MLDAVGFAVVVVTVVVLAILARVPCLCVGGSLMVGTTAVRAELGGLPTLVGTERKGSFLVAREERVFVPARVVELEARKSCALFSVFEIFAGESDVVSVEGKSKRTLFVRGETKFWIFVFEPIWVECSIGTGDVENRVAMGDSKKPKLSRCETGTPPSNMSRRSKPTSKLSF